MLSNRPSTFDRSESKSNGAASPWSTLRDLLLQREKETKAKLINWLRAQHDDDVSHVMESVSLPTQSLIIRKYFPFVRQHSTFQSLHFPLSSISISHMYTIKLQIVQLRRLLTLNRMNRVSFAQLIQAVSEKRGMRKQEKGVFRHFDSSRAMTFGWTSNSTLGERSFPFNYYAN